MRISKRLWSVFLRVLPSKASRLLYRRGVALSLCFWKIGGRDLGQHGGTQGISEPSNHLAWMVALTSRARGGANVKAKVA